jgi:adenosylcobinamide-GDP ribazoletransferase
VRDADVRRSRRLDRIRSAAAGASRALNALRAAFAYFSILPAGVAGAPEPDALAWLPVVGAVVGALAGTVGYFVGLVAPHPLAAAAAFGASLVLSGAIHLDGFLDCCDALFASVGVDRRLEILKDPRHGTFALAGFGAIAALWLAALVSIRPTEYPWVLAFAGATSRFGAVLNAYVVPYASGGRSQRAFERRPNAIILTLGLLTAAACTAYRPMLLAVLAGAVLAALIFGRAAAARLGGALVGDAYGAIVTVVEAGALAAARALH